MPKYAVLRNLAAGQKRSTSFESNRPNISTIAPPEPRLDVHEFDMNDVASVATDPHVEAIAPIMPITLIRPMAFTEIGGSNADDAAWGVTAVGADASSCSGKGVVVCILDTGIDKAHPAFGGVDLVEMDFSGLGNGDRQGHGSHCAGTIFGRNVDGLRIGVARGVEKALIGKVLRDDGSGDSDMIFRGLQWSLENGAQVVSMSLGFDFPGLVKQRIENGWPADLATSNALEAYRGNLRMFDAVMRMAAAMTAFRPGPVIVAAAGNESRTNENPEFKIAASLPAAAEGVVSVGALERRPDKKLGVAFFSNTFPQIAAPGVNILSVKAGGGLRKLNGTSMACPHVAGVAALWWESLRKSGAVNPSAQQVLAQMLASARTDCFASGVTIADRGAGLIASPP